MTSKEPNSQDESEDAKDKINDEGEKYEQPGPVDEAHHLQDHKNNAKNKSKTHFPLPFHIAIFLKEDPGGIEPRTVLPTLRSPLEEGCRGRVRMMFSVTIGT